MADSPENALSGKCKAELTERLAFTQLDDAGRAKIRSLKPIIDRELPKALDRFYDRMRATPEASRFFGGEPQIARAKGSQGKHWEAISSGQFDAGFMENVRKVGLRHAKIGLAPKWYIGGYSIIFEHLLISILREIWPKGLFGRDRDARAEEVGSAIGALGKAVLLDIDLAISVYLEALEAERAKSEAAKREGDAAAQAAMKAIATGLTNLAAKQLTYRVSSDMPPAFEKLQTDFNSALSLLQQALLTVFQCADAITAGTGDIASAADDLSRRTEQQAANLEETAAALEELTATIGKTAEGAKHAREIVNQAKGRAQKSGEVVEMAVAAMSRIQKSSAEIGQIIGVIDEIAFQTNLLALNAGVEAARAGDSGRGFAVVASEVRALAQRSADAAKQIKALITTSNTEVQAGVKLVAETGDLLTNIATGVSGIDQLVADIASSTTEQASALGEINTAINHLDHATQQNAAMAEQATAASGSLARESERLSSLIREFKIGSAAASAAAPPPRLERRRAAS